MKRVTIFSFVLGANTGQFFQAFGLQSEIRKQGFCVKHYFFNNHVTSEIWVHLKSFSIFKYCSYIIFWCYFLRFTRAPQGQFVYGADMIWHCKGFGLGSVEALFFGVDEWSPTERCAYAPSAGAQSEPFSDDLNDSLRKFSMFGVRDANTKALVKSTDKPIEYVLDPAFFLDQNQWLRSVVARRSGDTRAFERRDVKIGLYLSDVNRRVDRLSRLIAGVFSSQVRFLEIGFYARKNFFRNLLRQFQSPFESVKDFGKCDFVVTNTFHGVVFCLLTRTPFVAINHPNLEARLNNPLMNFFSRDRIIDEIDLEKFIAKRQDLIFGFDDFSDDKMKSSIETSRRFLKTMLSGVC